MSKIENFKHYSQLNSEIDEKWQRSACGIVCVKMVLDYFYPEKSHSIADLISEGVIVKAYDGMWSHSGLSLILRNHGVLAYNQEFKSHTIDLNSKKGAPSEYAKDFRQYGLQKIKEEVRKGRPVIISVAKNFSQNESSHLVVVADYLEKDGETIFVIFDPIMSDGGTQITEEYLLSFWRDMAIFTATNKA